MRTLALDLGSKWIGCAVSDEGALIASPLRRLARRGDDEDIGAVLQLLGETHAAALVIGLPLQLDGREGPRARRARRFATRLAARFDGEVLLWDERFSTSAAERALLEGKMRRQRRRETVDKVAAAVILQGYLDAGGQGAILLSSAGEVAPASPASDGA
jgi:putative Holliday junction resolvase